MSKDLIISGGACKGRRVAVPPGEIRPVMSMVREVIFQVIANLLQNMRRGTVLSGSSDILLRGFSAADLFCGSGLMMLEFASRGAENAVGVESDSQKWSVIEANSKAVMKEFGTGGKVFLYKDKAERFVLKHRRCYDIVYCDPPFAYLHKDDLLKKIAASALVRENTIVVLHAPAREKFSNEYTAHRTQRCVMRKANERVFGGSVIWFWTVHN